MEIKRLVGTVYWVFFFRDTVSLLLMNPPRLKLCEVKLPEMTLRAKLTQH